MTMSVTFQIFDWMLICPVISPYWRQQSQLNKFCIATDINSFPLNSGIKATCNFSAYTLADQ